MLTGRAVFGHRNLLVRLTRLPATEFSRNERPTLEIIIAIFTLIGDFGGDHLRFF
jgi:hypothetical protein